MAFLQCHLSERASITAQIEDTGIAISIHMHITIGWTPISQLRGVTCHMRLVSQNTEIHE